MNSGIMRTTNSMDDHPLKNEEDMNLQSKYLSGLAFVNQYLTKSIDELKMITGKQAGVFGQVSET